VLPWPLYLQINDWFMEEGTAEGVFGAMFLKLTVNLACRGDNTKQVCLKHLMYSGDSFAIPSPMKNAIREGMISQSGLHGIVMPILWMRQPTL